MAVSVVSSGSQTATVSTEHTLDTITTAGVYQLAVDLNAMTDGSTEDRVTIRVYGKARSSDTERLMEQWEFTGSQAKPLFRTNPEISPHSYKVTLRQDQGTGRAFPWAIYTV